MSTITARRADGAAPVRLDASRKRFTGVQAGVGRAASSVPWKPPLLATAFSDMIASPMDDSDRLRPLLARCPTRLGPVVAVGPGWDAILLSLDSALSALDPDYTISQVKEKLNGLCFYYAPSIGVSDEVADRMRRLVSDAEQACSTVCVETGGPGVLMVSPRGWMITMDPLAAPPGWTVARDEPDDLGDVPFRRAISVDDPAELRRLLIEQERKIQHLDGLLQHTLLVVQRLYDALSAKSDTASDGDSDSRGR